MIATTFKTKFFRPLQKLTTMSFSETCRHKFIPIDDEALLRFRRRYSIAILVLGVISFIAEEVLVR